MVRKQNPERKAKLLSSALKMFVEKGVQNTSTAEIAKAAGTAAGTLFIYFPTKQDLLDELVLTIGKQQSDTIKSLLEPTLPVRETFLTIWNGSVQWFLENIEAYQYIQQVRDSRIISESVIQESNKFFDYYYDVIQKGLNEGSIKPYPAAMIGEILYQDVVAIMTLIRIASEPTQPEEIIRLGFEIFWDGIKVEEGLPPGEKP